MHNAVLAVSEIQPHFVHSQGRSRTKDLPLEETKLTAETQIWGHGMQTIASDSILVHKNIRNFRSVVIFSCQHSHVLLITLQVIDLRKYHSQDRHKLNPSVPQTVLSIPWRHATWRDCPIFNTQASPRFQPLTFVADIYGAWDQFTLYSLERASRQQQFKWRRLKCVGEITFQS